jgi:adenylylsulfate kinase-like enzyme
MHPTGQLCHGLNKNLGLSAADRSKKIRCIKDVHICMLTEVSGTPQRTGCTPR